MGLQSGMLVSDGSQIRHVGLWWVFDNNNGFVNSRYIDIKLDNVQPLFEEVKYIYIEILQNILPAGI